MPQLGETVTEGTITRWLKQVGDRVETDEPLFEVSTDKVDSEVPAPSSGVLTEILVPEGDTVDVGTRIAVLGDPTAAASPSPAVAAAPAPPPPSAPAAAPAPAVAPAPPPPVAPAPPVPDVPSAGPVAVTSAAPAPPQTSPVVRKLLAERGLDPSTIQGSGFGGRLTRKDVQDAAAKKAPPAAPSAVLSAPSPPAEASAPPIAPSPPAPAPAPPAPAHAPAEPAGAPAGAGDEVVPFDNIRRRTADHMVRSKATSAHVYTSVEVDFEKVERARAAHKDEWKAREGFSLTYLPFVARAFCDTVHDFPRVNASVGDGALIVHHDVHLSVAVDLDFNGLVAPVIRNADDKRLAAIAHDVHDLALRARNRQLMPDDVLGGTFTITNPGPYGTYMTLPIINQPQVAILSTDTIKKRPVAVSGPDGEDVIAIHHVGVLALAWDHRAFDGAYAAAFLSALRDELERRNWEEELD